VLLGQLPQHVSCGIGDGYSLCGHTSLLGRQ
jgi:hypothetical protein